MTNLQVLIVRDQLRELRELCALEDARREREHEARIRLVEAIQEREARKQ